MALTGNLIAASFGAVNAGVGTKENNNTLIITDFFEETIHGFHNSTVKFKTRDYSKFFT